MALPIPFFLLSTTLHFQLPCYPAAAIFGELSQAVGVSRTTAFEFRISTHFWIFSFLSFFPLFVSFFSFSLHELQDWALIASEREATRVKASQRGLALFGNLSSCPKFLRLVGEDKRKTTRFCIVPGRSSASIFYTQTWLRFVDEFVSPCCRLNARYPFNETTWEHDRGLTRSQLVTSIRAVLFLPFSRSIVRQIYPRRTSWSAFDAYEKLASTNCPLDPCRSSTIHTHTHTHTHTRTSVYM